MAKAMVAIIGRPNVGKSTFFNYLAGERISIVEDEPGVTRDRILTDCEWRGRTFTIIDTGGIEMKSDEPLSEHMRRQARMAMEMADVIVFLTDLKQGVTADDMEVSNIIRRLKKPTVLLVNKCDKTGKTPDDIYEFYNLGLGEPFPISCINGLGIGDALDEIYNSLPEDIDDNYDDDIVKVAIIGKPNVGKSSLVNKILGEERVIVSDIAGTTRDAVDSYFQNDFGKYVFIDTAGLRKKSKVDEKIERYSVIRSKSAIQRADVCLLLIDAEEGVTDQDTKIAGEAHEAGKAVIIVVNKWDKIEKDTHTLEQYRKSVYEKLAYMTYAPVLFISAQTGQRVGDLFEKINYVFEQNSLRVSTSALNNVLNEAIAMVQPPSDKGKRLKVYYMTQASIRPPTFVVFVNNKDLMHFSYQRYIENQIRKNFGMEGTPIRFVIRERGEE